ncbi:MAG TPA: SDR family oxidoreductase [Candidatus Eisenbacteria bacterium]|jgi:NAD(P)-dependent dehydrogenase (short-subunit alcohol dehydrogenase family)|nr:SDR family oxidoreductase [Candidatus Eisenbacteria bacterium]
MPASGSLQLVLITGGSDGLGRAAAILLAERGYRVIAAGRSAKKLADLESLAAERKLPIHTVDLDVCDDQSVKAAMDRVANQHGSIDVLINNAGVGYMAAVEEIAMADFKQQFETNLFGVLRVTQAVLPAMRARRSGRILMISSVAGLVSPPTYGAYSSSKHALEGVSNALRLELYPFGIRVVLIEPGYIATNFQQTAKDLAQPYFEGAADSPYRKIYEGASKGANKGRSGSKTTPEDCARVMLEAIQSPDPRVRYGVTPLATLVKWGKRLASDRVLDQFLRRYYGITSTE